jgi:hypothetical protein
MTDETITEQDLTNACTHGRSKTIAPDIRWCLICGALQRPDKDDWEFPESHMHENWGADTSLDWRRG